MVLFPLKGCFSLLGGADQRCRPTSRNTQRPSTKNHAARNPSRAEVKKPRSGGIENILQTLRRGFLDMTWQASDISWWTVNACAGVLVTSVGFVVMNRTRGQRPTSKWGLQPVLVLLQRLPVVEAGSGHTASRKGKTVWSRCAVFEERNGVFGNAASSLRCQDARSNSRCPEDSNKNTIGGSFANGALGRGLVLRRFSWAFAPWALSPHFFFWLYCKGTQCNAWWNLGEKAGGLHREALGWIRKRNKGDFS